jgi:stage II sporulation SpoE-like protein/7TM protein involved in diverse intracellular signaling
MLRTSIMRLRAFILTAGIFTIAHTVLAQSVDLQQARVPIAVLSGPWRFHTGDDPSFANPTFDDSSWSLLTADKGWSEQGYPGYGGVAWYRLAVTLPAQHGPLSIYIPNVDVSCEVYVNGRFVGQKGGLPPHPHWVTQYRLLFPIPDDLVSSPRLLLAIRVWAPPRFSARLDGGLYPAPRIGNATDIAHLRALGGYKLYWENSYLVLELFANSIGALASLIMFALRRKEREYLWFGIYLSIWTLYGLAAITSIYRPVSYYLSNETIILLIALGFYTGVEFYSAMCRQRRGWLYRAAVFFVLAVLCLSQLSGVLPQYNFSILYAWAYSGVWTCVAAMVYRAWRSGNKDGRLLMLPSAIAMIPSVLKAVVVTPPFAHQAWALATEHFLDNGIRWPFSYDFGSFIGDFSNLLVLFVVINRFARSRRDEERFESELEAARAVQQVLIPDEVPAIPGFQIQAVYQPASQVGGDFFQIVAVKSGAALLVIGDVSGKGMPAAMTVSLLVGTFRTLAHYTQSPAEILQAMNQRMLSRSGGGFTTCLVLRADPGGAVIAANAGHLAPYLAGREVSVDAGLPLGLTPDSRYIETRFHINPGDELTLLTDGVLEARNAQHELFGFERTAAISTQSVQNIAAATYAFGQQDDVTVVRIAFSSGLAPATPSFAPPATA